MGTISNSDKIKILIVDDHTLVREGFAKMLELDPQFVVLGQASAAQEAIQKAKELKPDIILMDIKLPGINGIEATKLIKKDYPDIEVIILSMYDEEEYVLESVKAGASGYVLKDISQEELYSAIKVVHSGGSLIQPGLARKVLKEFASMAKGAVHPGKGSTALKELSAREIEVLQCVSEGKSNKEIAEQLIISEKTVKAHLRTIFRKLDVGDRAQAVAEAMRKGLVE